MTQAESTGKIPYYIKRITSSRENTIMLALACALVFAIASSVGIGKYPISFGDFFSIVLSWFTGNTAGIDESSVVIVNIVRIPRILLCVIVGMALASSGAVYQGLFKNPMVSPDILGVSTGASVGASIAILMDASFLTIQLMAFGFGISAVLLVTGLATVVGRGNPALLVMILSGMVISSLFGACNALIVYMAAASDTKLADITFWLMGSFAKAGSYENVGLLSMVLSIGALPLLALRWKINVLSFGEEEAQAMGVNTRLLRVIIIVCGTLLTASTVALCGNIGWVGLTLPHICRMLVGPNYKALLPTTMLAGALFLVIVDNIARTIVPGELPIGVITSLIGAPVFIFLMFRRKEGWT